MLTTRDLIARMTPTALAETIVSIEQIGNLDAAESATIALLRKALQFNVGDVEAARLIGDACGVAR